MLSKQRNSRHRRRNRRKTYNNILKEYGYPIVFMIGLILGASGHMLMDRLRQPDDVESNATVNFCTGTYLPILLQEAPNQDYTNDRLTTNADIASLNHTTTPTPTFVPTPVPTNTPNVTKYPNTNKPTVPKDSTQSERQNAGQGEYEVPSEMFCAQYCSQVEQTFLDIGPTRLFDFSTQTPKEFFGNNNQSQQIIITRDGEYQFVVMPPHIAAEAEMFLTKPKPKINKSMFLEADFLPIHQLTAPDGQFVSPAEAKALLNREEGSTQALNAAVEIASDGSVIVHIQGTTGIPIK